MNTQRVGEVLYESEAALRLVDHELLDLHEPRRESRRLTPAYMPGLAELPLVLERANAQILTVLQRLRESRQALQNTTVEKLAVTHEKIREVTIATEDAATNILDACDRAAGIVDELDAIDDAPAPDRTRAGELRSTLRDELFLMMGALQFQDITAQQLSHAGSVLVEMEGRLLEVAKLFDLHHVELPMLPVLTPSDTSTFDPNASTRNVERRQSVADEIFTKVPAA